MQGEGALWVDVRTFVVFGAGSSVLGSVDSATLTPTGADVGSLALPNGRGAVAVPLSSSLDATSRFAVWTSQGTSSPVSGVPVAWSRDGSRLAIWHWTSGPSGPTVRGWIEVVAWPGLRSALQIKSHPTSPFRGQVQFDPAGQHLYVNGAVVNLVSGTVTPVIPGFQPGDPTWTWDGQLVVPSLDGRDAAVFDVNGQERGSVPGTGSNVVAAADGSLVASWSSASASPILLIRGSRHEEVGPPGPVQDVVPDPTGATLVAIAAAEGGISAFLLQP